MAQKPTTTALDDDNVCNANSQLNIHHMLYNESISSIFQDAMSMNTSFMHCVIV